MSAQVIYTGLPSVTSSCDISREARNDFVFNAKFDFHIKMLAY